MARPVRIANVSGFWGDRVAAAREMVDGGPVDVLTGDWLAELTMVILARQRARDPLAGFATSFLTQVEDVLGTCLDRGIRFVANAGGLAPERCAAAVEAIAARLGLAPRVAFVDGDDLAGSLEAIAAGGTPLVHAETGEALGQRTVLTANAYLGGWGIRTALDDDADVVVTGRVADASLVVGAAAWHHGWARTDFDRIAGAIVAGHAIECGTQVTGGNYAFFDEIPNALHLGFPIAEVADDGSAIITKHPGHGGAVTVGTVTAQLLYEIGAPSYVGPDAIARFDTIVLEDLGHDRVRIHGVRGEPPPRTAKVGLAVADGWRLRLGVAITGLDVEAKAALFERQLRAATEGLGLRRLEAHLVRTDKRDPRSNEEATATLEISADADDEAVVGRALRARVTELALASFPGLWVRGVTARPEPLVRFWPTFVGWEWIHERVTTPSATITLEPPPWSDGAHREVAQPEPAVDATVQPSDAFGPCRIVPLGRLVGARSGDKGLGEPRGVGQNGGSLRLARWLLGRRRAPKAAAGGCAAPGRALCTPQPASAQLRHPWTARGGRLSTATGGCAGQESWRMAACPTRPYSATVPRVSETDEILLLERRDGVVRMTLNDVARRNALSPALLDALHGALREGSSDEDVRAMVITNAGSVFCAGADLAAAGTSAGDHATLADVLLAIEESPKPVIGRIGGHAFGGGLGLAAACDISIASSEARFGFTEVRLGVAPAIISVVCLPKLRRSDALELFLTAERFEATRAVASGLITRAVEPARLDAEVDEVIAAVLRGAPGALAVAKRLALGHDREASREAYAAMTELSQALFAGAEAAEGIAAFRERRAAAWVPLGLGGART